METAILEALEQFIVRAKRATYAGDGRPLLPYRLGSHDLQFTDGEWSYHDSYFGGSDFIGQEVVYYRGASIWGMNYYGYILKPDQIDAAQAGQMIKRSLSALYGEGRFLGGFEHSFEDLKYVDTNEGDVHRFSGKEFIYRVSQLIYELVYHGGLIRD
jgi:Domain of unknown function (DUF5680)